MPFTDRSHVAGIAVVGVVPADRLVDGRRVRAHFRLAHATPVFLIHLPSDRIADISAEPSTDRATCRRPAAAAAELGADQAARRGADQGTADFVAAAPVI